MIDRLDEVVRACMLDGINYEGAKVIADDDAAIIDYGYMKRCAFPRGADVFEELRRRGVSGLVCVMDLTEDAAKKTGGAPCRTYAYFGGAGAAENADIRPLDRSYAKIVRDAYDGGDNDYTADEIAEIMQTKGVLGLFDGQLAGFIGRHGEGSMGMLTVLEKFRRRGYGEKLERAMINKVLSEGRMPFCDVYTDNLPSLKLQDKLGMTAAEGFTVWFDA